MLRYGIITEVFPDDGFARVKFTDDDNVSGKLQFLTQSSLQDKYSFTFDINQQVAVMMDENSEDGVILGALFNNTNKPPTGSGAGIVKMVFGDESEISYDRNTHKLNIDVKGDIGIKAEGTIKVEAEQVEVEATTVTVDAEMVDVSATTIQLTGEVTLTGNLTATGIISAAQFAGGAGGMTVSGDIEATGEVKGATVKAGTVDLGTHIHGGVTPGAGSTAAPTP